MGNVRMRNGLGGNAHLPYRKEAECHDRVGQRDAGCHAQSAADAHRLTMHEAEIGHHGACERKGRSLHKITLDDEDADRARG